jgi:hypothetical protein
LGNGEASKKKIIANDQSCYAGLLNKIQSVQIMSKPAEIYARDGLMPSFPVMQVDDPR